MSSVPSVEQNLSVLSYNVNLLNKAIGELSTTVNSRFDSLDSRLTALEERFSTLNVVEPPKAPTKKRGTNPLSSLEGTKVKRSTSTGQNISNWARKYITDNNLLSSLPDVSSELWSVAQSEMSSSKHQVNTPDYNRIVAGKFFTLLKKKVDTASNTLTEAESTFYNNIKTGHTSYKSEFDKNRTESSEESVSEQPVSNSVASEVANVLAGLN
jgi:hypothetical protein